MLLTSIVMYRLLSVTTFFSLSCALSFTSIVRAMLRIVSVIILLLFYLYTNAQTHNEWRHLWTTSNKQSDCSHMVYIYLWKFRRNVNIYLKKNVKKKGFMFALIQFTVDRSMKFLLAHRFFKYTLYLLYSAPFLV